MLSVIKKLCYNFVGNSKSQRAFKSHYWFKSYSDFSELVDFAYWWSFIGGGSAINGATPSSLLEYYKFNCRKSEYLKIRHCQIDQATGRLKSGRFLNDQAAA